MHNRNMTPTLLAIPCIIRPKLKGNRVPGHAFRVASWLLLAMFCCSPALAAPVDSATARTVAEHFLAYLNADSRIVSITPADAAANTSGYLVTLAPDGYILVAADDIRVPVKAYSLKSSFSALPPAYRDNLIRESRVDTVLLKTNQPLPNSDYWSFLKNGPGPQLAKDYLPDTHLLTTTWGQRYPYNKLNPTTDTGTTVTGCVQTAIAQLMRYHKHPATGSGVFHHSWNDQELTAGMKRPFHWDLMPDNFDTAQPEHSKDEVAALMRDLGIFNEADFGVNSTGAPFYSSSFSRAFGYTQISVKSSEAADFITTIRDEINSLRPVLLIMPGHMVVADGYSESQTGTKVHINMGWDGAYDNYYYLDQTIFAGGYSFAPDHVIYYNIAPCTGDSCPAPYEVEADTAPPFIGQQQSVIVNSPHTLRIDHYDPDNSPVTLSASSNCATLGLTLENNILTIIPADTGSYCQVTLFAESEGSYNAGTFNVLTPTDALYAGTRFELSDLFTSQNDTNSYQVYLGGETTIASSRYLFLWVENSSGQTVASSSTGQVTETFEAGEYTILAALESQSSYYPYNPDTASYTMQFSTGASVDDVAADLGYSHQECQLQTATGGDGAGSITTLPTGISCGANCNATFTCDSEILLTATADMSSMFTGWSGECTGTETTVFATISGINSCTATFSIDGDHDGLPDSWETSYGLDTTQNSATGDADGDGLTNLEEYLAGSPPVVLAGDINWSDTLTLTDALLGLQISTGSHPAGVTFQADVDGDSGIGLAETLFILQEIAGL